MKAKDVRRGTIVIYRGAPHRILEFQHKTPGNKRGFVQVKLRNVLNGIQCEEKFSSTEEVEEADIYTAKATFLYRDGSGYHFMQSDTLEQYCFSDEQLGQTKYYLSDGLEVDLSTFNDVPIDVVPPKTVILAIEDTQPELRGATASNSPKPATTETGLTVTVPPFLKIGDRIVVDTTTGGYLSRAD